MHPSIRPSFHPQICSQFLHPPANSLFFHPSMNPKINSSGHEYFNNVDAAYCNNRNQSEDDRAGATYF
jgi:hypothetical protein